MTSDQIVKHLRSLGSVESVEGMQRFGIVTTKAFGIATPVLKQFAREVKKTVLNRHSLAGELWDTGIYEARSVAFLIDDPKQVTPEQMDSWARDFDNWATVDGACGYLFCRTAYAYAKAFQWSDEDAEFVKRAGFSMMAYLAVHDKKAPDGKLLQFLPIIEKHADDERNFVKKAVNWALRQIGKRSRELHEPAIETAKRIARQDSKSARWIAADALRELRSEKVIERLERKAG